MKYIQVGFGRLAVATLFIESLRVIGRSMRTNPAWIRRVWVSPPEANSKGAMAGDTFARCVDLMQVRHLQYAVTCRPSGRADEHSRIQVEEKEEKR